MYSVGSVFAGVAVAVFITLLIWLLVLSWLLRKQNNFLKSLFPKSGERDIRKKFEEIQELVSGFDKKIGDLGKELESFGQDGLGHLQKVSLLRYNPFEDTGGDQSFSAAFLDKKGSGVVITGMHGRDATRVFAKDVVLGRAGRYEFSKEEEKVVREAMK